MKRMIPILLLAAGLFFVFGQAVAAEEGGQRSNHRGRSLSKGNAPTTNRTLVNVGQVSMWIYADAISANTPGGDSGLFFPRGNNPSTAAIFQDGFVYGGKVSDGSEPIIRAGGQTYSTGMVPGAILSPGVAEDIGDSENVDRIWRVRKDFASADLALDAAELNEVTTSAVTDAQIAAVREQYRADWIEWPVHKGAPFYDADGDGQYNPAFEADGSPKLAPTGDQEFNPDIHADEPGVAGADQVVWGVANDLDAGAVQTLYGSPSIGIEMQFTLWAYRRADALGNIVFKQFRLIYKGTAATPPNASIDSMYFCQWSDPDLGSFGDDYAGTDTTLSLGFAYNATSNDANYAAVGLPPPASGYDFFAGPLVEDPDGEAVFGLEKRPGFRNLPMSTFAFFAAGGNDSDPTRGGDYNGTLQWWNLLRGFRPRPELPPEPWTDPTNNNAVTLFRVPGDPVTGEGWIDSNPGDRRILLASGPFTMAVGDTQETVVAVMAALGSDRLSSVSVLKFVDRFAQSAFDNLFELPSPPPTPQVAKTEFNGQILLNWGEDAEAVREVEQSVDRGYAFEGYRVYQLPSAGATADQGVLLGTFDVVNEVTTIAQETFDPASGLILELPVIIGSNSGITRTFTINTDRLRDLPLINGQTYYFGVSAYSFNPSEDVTTKTLESPLAIVTVVPQTTKPGVRFKTTRGDTLTVEHMSGVSDGSVTPMIVDPSKTKDANYEVQFKEIVDNSDPEHPVTKTVWDLVNTTSGEVLLADQENQSGDSDYLITDGLQVIVSGPPLQGLDWDYNGERWITGGSHGGEIFFGGAFLGPNFVGSSVPAAEYVSIEMDWFARTGFTDLNGNGQYDIGEPYELDPNEGQKAHLYTTWGGGNYEGFFQVPFVVRNRETGEQLDVLVRDRDGNMQWDLHKLWDEADPNFVDVNGGDLQFNYIFIMDTPYDETGARYDPNQGGIDAFADILNGTQAIQWALWVDQRGSREPLGDTFDIYFIAPKVNTPNDVFAFSSAGATFSASTAVSDLEMVNVFPNPYLGVNSREENRFQRFVTFSHLPQKATIRIFTLAGVLVRTLQKDNASQFTTWDLQTERGLPVASGLYIAHIEFPDLNETKILKMAVVREEQFLRNF